MKFPSNLLQVTILPGVALIQMGNGVGVNGPSWTNPSSVRKFVLIIIGIRVDVIRFQDIAMRLLG